eukprot:UN23520
MKKSGVELTVKPGNSVYSQKDESWVETLKKECPQASFGHGNKTVQDRKVRDALQLKAEEFDLLNFDLEKSGIIEKVQSELCPNDPEKLTFERYSLNMYGRGGHFKRHKDTPRTEDNIGTLLLFLPSRYSHGELQITHGGVNKEFSFGSNPKEDEFNWVAFFGDVDHAVKSLWHGIRLTIAFNLNRGAETKKEEKKEQTFEEKTKVLINQFQKCLNDESFMDGGGNLGFPCYHLYTNGQVFTNATASDPLDKKRIQKLKGKDFHVALAAAHCGLKIYLQPYLYPDNSEEGEWKTKKFVSKSQIPRQAEECIMPGEFLPPDEEDSDDVQWIEDRNTNAKKLKDCQYSATGYFGNCASVVTFYVCAGLIIEIPDSEERQANVNKSKKEFKPSKATKRKLE